MLCECRSAARRLAVFGPAFREQLEAVNAIFASDAWQAMADGDGAIITLQPGTAWSGVSDVVNFLRSAGGEAAMDDLQMGWLPGCPSADLADGAARDALVDVQPMRNALNIAPTPLLDVLMNRRIQTWFQPVFRADQSLWGHECLARAHDAAGERIAPSTLFADARAERLTFMLDRVCRETHVASAGAAGLPEDSKILINFLPTAIYEPAFCLRTTEALIRKHRIAHDRIIFEVVESEQVADREHLIKIFGHYRKNGFQVALDDVGAGYAGLSMLGDLNPDLIKIDRDLVIKAENSRMHRSICNGLIQIAHEFDKLALAEGVETREQCDMMRNLGADLIQGFYLGRPSPEPVRRSVPCVA